MNELDIFENYLNAQTWYTRPFLPKIMRDTLNSPNYSFFRILLAAIQCQNKAFISWFPGFADLYHSFYFTSCRLLHDQGLLCLDFAYHPHWREIYRLYLYIYTACRLSENKPLATQLFQEFLTLSATELSAWNDFVHHLAQLDLLNPGNMRTIGSYSQREDIFFLLSLDHNYLRTLIPPYRRGLQELLENPSIKGLLSHPGRATCKLIFDFLFLSFGSACQPTIYLAVLRHHDVVSLWRAIDRLKEHGMLNGETVESVVHSQEPFETALFLTLPTLTPSALDYSSQSPSPATLNRSRNEGYGWLSEFRPEMTLFGRKEVRSMNLHNVIQDNFSNRLA